MKVGRLQSTQLSASELRDAKAQALAWGIERWPDKVVTVHAYYAGDFYLEVRDPGEKRAPVIAARV